MLLRVVLLFVSLFLQAIPRCKGSEVLEEVAQRSWASLELFKSRLDEATYNLLGGIHCPWKVVWN